MKRLTIAGLGLLLWACEDDQPRYTGLELDALSSPPESVGLTVDRIEIPAGIAVQVKATIHSTGQNYHADDLLVLRSDDDDVLTVYATESAREYVLVGVHPGATCLNVKINRAEKECIEVRVLVPGE
jgi:hypothetical protein